MPIQMETRIQIATMPLPASGSVVWPSDPLPAGWTGFGAWQLDGVVHNGVNTTLIFARYIYRDIVTP